MVPLVFRFCEEGVLLTNAKKVTVSVLYWYEKLSGQVTDQFLERPERVLWACSSFLFRTSCSLLSNIYAPFRAVRRAKPLVIAGDFNATLGTGHSEGWTDALAQD